MAFDPNKVITSGKADGSAWFKSLSGKVAKEIGEALQVSYKWTRPVVLDMSKLEKYAKKAEGTDYTYKVRADSKVKTLILELTDENDKVEEFVVIKNLSEFEGAEVINLQGADPTMVKTSSKQAKKFNDDSDDKATYNDPRKGKAQVEESETDLGDIGKHNRIVLCGHGGGKSDVSGAYVATKFGGRTAKDVVEFLMDEGLKDDYAGTVYLSGCHSAAGFDSPENFAKVVRDLLAKKGYKKVSVAGTPGTAYTNKDGDKYAKLDVLENELDSTIDKVEKLVKNLREAKARNDEELESLGQQVKLAAEEHAYYVDMCSDIAQEDLTTINRVLLDPLKETHDELAAELKKLEESAAIIAKGLKGEEKYLDELQTLKKSKELDPDEFKKTLKTQFAVDEWWGVFGPAQKSVKVKTSKLEKLKAGLGKLKEKLQRDKK